MTAWKTCFFFETSGKKSKLQLGHADDGVEDGPRFLTVRALGLGCLPREVAGSEVVGAERASELTTENRFRAGFTTRERLPVGRNNPTTELTRSLGRNEAW